MSQKVIEGHRKRIKEEMVNHFLRPGPSISVEGIHKDNTLFIDCHGGTLEQAFIIPSNLKMITYTRKNSNLLSDEVIEFYTKLTRLNSYNRTGEVETNLLSLPKNLGSETSECHIYNENPGEPPDCELFFNAKCSFSFKYDTGRYQRLGFLMYDDLIKDEEIGKLFDKGELILKVKEIEYEDLLNYCIYEDDETEESKVFKEDLENKLGGKVVRNLSRHISSKEELLNYIGEKVKLSDKEKKIHLWLHSDKLKGIINGYQNSISRAAKSVARRAGIKKESKYDQLVRYILEEKKGKIHLNELIKRIDTDSNQKIKNYVLLFCRSEDIRGSKDRRPSGTINNRGMYKTEAHLKSSTYSFQEQCGNRKFDTSTLDKLKRIQIASKALNEDPSNTSNTKELLVKGLKKTKKIKKKREKELKKNKKINIILILYIYE